MNTDLSVNRDWSILVNEC